MQPRERIREALARDVKAGGRPALVAFLTAGYPEPREFLGALRAIASAADAIEIGVPFSDPMADGVTIQRSSQHAIEHGVSLAWILDELGHRDFELTAPVLLMSYLNPLLAFGYGAHVCLGQHHVRGRRLRHACRSAPAGLYGVGA